MLHCRVMSSLLLLLDGRLLAFASPNPFIGERLWVQFSLLIEIALAGHCCAIPDTNANIYFRRLGSSSGSPWFGASVDSQRLVMSAGRYPAQTNYLYMTYNASEHDLPDSAGGTIVLGSGAYRIGSSVEFDYATVITARTLIDNNQRTYMLNYNPETVSTDYDESDKL